MAEFHNQDTENTIFSSELLTTNLPHLEDKMHAIKSAPKIAKWLKRFNNKTIKVKSAIVTDVNFFGPPEPNRLGFLKVTADAYDAQTNTKISSIAFIRGDSVAILIIVTIQETGKKYVLMCEQLRFPVGRRMVEACAGMIDHLTGDIIGVAFKEVKEETGFIINKDDPKLVSHGSIFPSPGGCDEEIHLYSWSTTISQAEFEEKQTSVFGEGQYESIKLIFYEYDTFPSILNQIGDVKSECIWRRMH